MTNLRRSSAALFVILAGITIVSGCDDVCCVLRFCLCRCVIMSLYKFVVLFVS